MSDYPQTSVSCIVRTQYPYFVQRYAGITGFGPVVGSVSILLFSVYALRPDLRPGSLSLHVPRGHLPGQSEDLLPSLPPARSYACLGRLHSRLHRPYPLQSPAGSLPTFIRSSAFLHSAAPLHFITFGVDILVHLLEALYHRCGYAACRYQNACRIQNLPDRSFSSGLQDLRPWRASWRGSLQRSWHSRRYPSIFKSRAFALLCDARSDEIP